MEPGPTESSRRRSLLALVRTATSSGPDAVAAWNRRAGDFDLDAIWDRELLRLLPAAGTALAAAGHDDPDLPRLRGIQRKTWVEHQLQATALVPWLDTLQAVGVEAGVAGGALLARTAWAYGDTPGVRWADDTRLLVRPDEAGRALDALVTAGAQTRSPARLERRRRLHAGVPVRFGGRWIELAWLPTPAMRHGAEWWANGTTLTIADRQVRALDPAVATVVCCAGLVSGTAGVSAALDLCRLVGHPAVDARDVDRVASRAGVTTAVAVARELVARIRDHGDDGWVDRFLPASGLARARTAWWSTSVRLGAARAVVSSPELLAERWHLDRVGSLPVAFASRVADRVRRDGAHRSSASPAR